MDYGAVPHRATHPLLEDAEKGAIGKDARPTKQLGPVYNGIGAALAIFFIANALSMHLQEFWLDHTVTRFALLCSAPFLFCISLFFALQIVFNVSMVIGPVAQFHQNSKYYSAVKPQPNPVVDSKLPHITIQMPVYKESLEKTIAPSVFSLKKAMQTYALQGGSSAIFINDDGLQLLNDKEREERIAFYATHNIGWVARPGHSDGPDGFKRAGRFKKASNMNYGLALSSKMEKHIVDIQKTGDGRCTDLEDRAMQMAINEIFEENGKRFRPWAMNGKSIRVGEIILIVDSDTVVPEDCFRDAARELAESPDLAVLQHASDVMQVSFNCFNNGIAYFTRRANKCISIGCANGSVAPFVGHNAFLRWSAVQDTAYIDADDGVRKIWSEDKVSEDFDMALRLQLAGYTTRWATYSEGGFKEGVSLTVDDELNRWQKYAYGCNELIFNPLKHWWCMGPISKQLRTFMCSEAPLHYKLSMTAYMCSYYGIAAGAPLSIINYLILGWALDVNGPPFTIWLATVVVFPVSGNLGYTMLEYRLGHNGLLASLKENMKWLPFFFLFFSGLSIHLLTALLAHLFSYNITWGATKKEVERSNFFLEIPKIWTRFWLSIVVSLVMCAGIIILASELVPLEWRIPGHELSLILPVVTSAGSHILFAVVFNPWLTIFSY